MWRILFLILVLFSSTAFARTSDTPLAVKFDEFETITAKNIKSRMDNYFAKLADNPTASAFILIYGKSKDIVLCVKEIQRVTHVMQESRK